MSKTQQEYQQDVKELWKQYDSSHARNRSIESGGTGLLDEVATYIRILERAQRKGVEEFSILFSRLYGRQIHKEALLAEWFASAAEEDSNDPK